MKIEKILISFFFFFLFIGPFEIPRRIYHDDIAKTLVAGIPPEYLVDTFRRNILTDTFRRKFNLPGEPNRLKIFANRHLVYFNYTDGIPMTPCPSESSDIITLLLPSSLSPRPLSLKTNTLR
uniref:Uncharacterized protein n=1 Tax=Brassica oleracea TaxID=3712 RepID=A0A3P6FBK7_BRAOL|nr:unnamed protein product [Brassica oleracea]